MTPDQILKHYWGYSSFRSPQAEVIEAFLEKKDVVAVLPTGAGKSICFQVASLTAEGICVVITPLIALMQDQVNQLKKRGIAAVAVYSGLNRTEIDIALDNCVYGKLKFLYVSPERLQTEIFQERFKKMNVNLVAIDEAHCISQWGYDFRPPYLKIAMLRELKPDVPFMAVTASATEAVKKDIIDHLKLRTPAIFQKSFARQNLSLVVRKTEAKENQVLNILRKVPGPAIVYVRSRKSTESISKYLVRNKVLSTFYHAGLAAEERMKHQQEWLNDEVRVMVATNAFGMGIDKANVRLVVHLDLPENIESYYQEAGRAGRDGKRSYATIIYHDADVDTLRHKSKLSQPELGLVKQVYQALANHYQIAEGSCDGEAFHFDLDNFCEKYLLKPLLVFPVLKKLEEFGLILLNEGFHRPSVLHFTIDRKKIYEFQVANAKFDSIIKTLMRLYGAELFSDFVVISENHVANAIKKTVKEVTEDLQRLQRLQLLIYEPASDDPQIIFAMPRQDAERLPIDKKEFEKRRNLHISKAESMIEYTEQVHRCRMQQIQDYFGEKTYDQCGLCDVCLNKKKTDRSGLLQDYTQQILFLLGRKPMSVEELEVGVAARDKDLFIEAVRELVDNGSIEYDDIWVLHKKISD